MSDIITDTIQIYQSITIAEWIWGFIFTIVLGGTTFWLGYAHGIVMGRKKKSRQANNTVEQSENT